MKDELVAKYNVSSLGLFGSVVRDDFNHISSDIDIIVDFSLPIGIEFVDLADFLESKLNKPVDLVARAGVKFVAAEEDGQAFEEKIQQITAALKEQMLKAKELDNSIKLNRNKIGYGW